MSLSLRSLALFLPADGATDAPVAATAGTLSLGGSSSAVGVGTPVAATPAGLGLGKPWTPESLDSSVLQLWCAADRNVDQTAGAKTAWTDASAHGRSVAAVNNSSTNPALVLGELNGLPVFRFNNSNGFDAAGDIGVNSNQFTVFVVAKAADDVGTNDLWTGRIPFDNAFVTRSAGDDSFRMYTYDPTFNEFGGFVGETRYGFDPSLSWLVHVNIFQGEPATGSLNGDDSDVVDVRPTRPGHVLAHLQEGVSIGWDRGSDGSGVWDNGWNGDIAEFGVLDGDADQALHDRLAGYTGHKYALIAGFPASHPYRFAPPVQAMGATIGAGVGIGAIEGELSLDATAATVATSTGAAIAADDGTLTLDSRSHAAGVGYALAHTDGELTLNASAEAVTAGTGLAATDGEFALDARTHPIAAGASLAAADGELALNASAHAVGVGYAVAHADGELALDARSHVAGVGYAVAAADAELALNAQAHPVAASVGIAATDGELALDARSHAAFGSAGDQILAVRGDVALNARSHALASGAGLLAGAAAMALGGTIHPTAAGAGVAASVGGVALGAAAHPLSVGCGVAATAGDLSLPQRGHTLSAGAGLLTGAGAMALGARGHTILDGSDLGPPVLVLSGPALPQSLAGGAERVGRAPGAPGVLRGGRA